MANFKSISPSDIQTTKSVLNQLVDFVDEDFSGSLTRKKLPTYITASSVGSVTSSLFQTVFDQDFTLQTSNELLDMTVGLFSGSGTVASASSGIDVNDKLLFVSNSLMMREKVNIYRQFSQILLGNANKRFTSPFSAKVADNSTANIDEALFLCFKRLFVRDGIKRETFAMRFMTSASSATSVEDGALGSGGQSNISRNTHSGSIIVTDVGSVTSKERTVEGAEVGNLVNASNTSENLGLIFYNHGVAILDLKKVTSASQFMSGTIDAVGNSSNTIIMGKAGQGNPNAKFIPDFINSASIDNIVDHIASVRVLSSSTPTTTARTCLTFQNNTEINSTLIFCRASPNEFNFSSNPTYTDSDGNLVVIDSGQEGIQKAFSFVTSVGLYDPDDQLIALAKLSRPVEKNGQKDLTFRVRLDF